MMHTYRWVCRHLLASWLAVVLVFSYAPARGEPSTASATQPTSNWSKIIPRLAASAIDDFQGVINGPGIHHTNGLDEITYPTSLKISDHPCIVYEHFRGMRYLNCELFSGRDAKVAAPRFRALRKTFSELGGNTAEVRQRSYGTAHSYTYSIVVHGARVSLNWFSGPGVTKISVSAEPPYPNALANVDATQRAAATQPAASD